MSPSYELLTDEEATLMMELSRLFMIRNQYETILKQSNLKFVERTHHEIFKEDLQITIDYYKKCLDITQELLKENEFEYK